MEEAICRLGHKRPTVGTHAAERFGHPVGVTGEEFVVFGRAKMANDAKLDDELVDQLLSLKFA